MCMIIDKIIKTKVTRKGWILRNKHGDVYYPVYNHMVKHCYAKLGDTVTDPCWCNFIPDLWLNREVGKGCLHVFKYRRSAVAGAGSLGGVVIVEVEILPGTVLEGRTVDYSIRLDPLPCYGVKSYRLVREYTHEN